MPHELVNSITLAYSDEAGGLSTDAAEELLEKFGPNSLPEKKPPSDLSIFISQLKSPLVYVLLAAAIITFVLGNLADTVIIGFAVFLNTILGFFQERKAGKALEALKKLVVPTAEVIRDGKIVMLGVEKIVPGDIVILSQGDKIPADGKLVEANRFFVTEAILTGESEPISKEEDHEVFMGTIVTAGKGRLLVATTGAGTEMGKIAQSIEEDGQDTPLTRQLKRFSRWLSVLVLVLTLIVFGVGLAEGGPLVDVFATSVALAVAAIPEGLLVGLTVVLAIGMQRILARKGLVRNLVSAETLGGVTTICIDKTGTLTQGKMQVVNVLGDEQEIATHVLLSDNLDTSVVVAAWEWSNRVVHKADFDKVKHFAGIDSIPFSSDHKFFATLNRWHDGHHAVFVTGAPELLLKNTKHTDAERAEIHKNIVELSDEGKRTLGFAKKIVPSSVDTLDKEKVLDNLEWSGLLAFTDPVRSDVAGALKRTMDAGIKIMVITGDFANTAVSVLRELGIAVAAKDVVLGEELETMSGKELEKKIFGGERDEVKLFARTKPEQKLKIVETLEMHGEVTAMMGDGVNDAPALSRADIGIVVGEATDVAKESADLVLLDSSFATIISAIEEGRGIFDNIRKIILYLMSNAFIEILMVLTALVMKLPAPLTAVQILWINLASDSLPHLALTVDPKSPGSMLRRPHPPKSPLISKWMLGLIATVSVVGWLVGFGSYFYVLSTTGNTVLAQSVAFMVVGVSSFSYVFSVRMLRDPFWRDTPFANHWLILAVAVGLIIQSFPLISAPVREFFGLVPLGKYWAIPLAAAVSIFVIVEVSKLFIYKRAHRRA